MEEGKSELKILRGKPTGKRPLERPKTTPPSRLKYQQDLKSAVDWFITPKSDNGTCRI